MKAGVISLVAAAAFAAPAQAQLRVPIDALPAGTPGCVDSQWPAPGPNDPPSGGGGRTCTWGPAQCSTSSGYIGGGTLQADRCAVTAGTASAGCSNTYTSQGLTHYSTTYDERCGVAVGDTQVERSCGGSTSAGGGHYTEDNECEVVAGDFSCTTDPDADATEAEQLAACLRELLP